MNRKHKSRQDRKAAPPKPITDAPFDVDVLDDGDIATPKRDLSEDEIKEQEDRRS